MYDKDSFNLTKFESLVKTRYAGSFSSLKKKNHTESEVSIEISRIVT